MREITSSKLLRVITLAGIGAFCLGAGYLSYLRAVVEFAGKERPSQWSSKLGEMTFDDIYKKIGPPQEDASAKQFQNWIEYHWWGIKMLKIVARDCCKPSARPNEVYYVVYVNGKYAPAYQETIFQSGR